MIDLFEFGEFERITDRDTNRDMNVTVMSRLCDIHVTVLSPSIFLSRFIDQ